MNPASDDRLLGEYRLKELLSENPLSRTWLAEQVSVSRRVLVDELRPEQAHQRDTFLADVRAKAAVDHPLIGSVFEAVAEPDLCFFAHELLPGATLEDRNLAAEPYKPARLAHVLRRIAEAQLHLIAMGQGTSPFGLKHVYLDDHDVIRLANLAIAAPRTPEQASRDIFHLGQALRPLVADGQPGSTRLLTLLGWMRGEGLEAPISWEQVRDLCTQIEQQLAEPLPQAAPTKPGTRAPKKPPVAAIAVSGVIIVMLAAGAIVWFRQPSERRAAPTADRRPLPGAILIPAGKHPTPDGPEQELPAYRISAHEVTIGQYAAFLETLETLTKNHRERTFDHEDQPQEKFSHQPDDWPALLAAAKSNEPWKGYPVTLDSPVVGVDWWDASAYALWQQCQLGTQEQCQLVTLEQWFAALRKDVTKPATLNPGSWIPITTTTTDRTPQGLLNMAGSVCEWTRCPAASPDNPLGERKWVIIGGSFLKPGSNALTREWTDNRSLRRPDLGFRIVFEAK